MLKKTTSKSLSVVSQEITINTDETKKADRPHLIEKILANLKILGILILRAPDNSFNIFKNNENLTVEIQRNIHTLQFVDVFVFTENNFTGLKGFVALHSYNINFRHRF